MKCKKKHTKEQDSVYISSGVLLDMAKEEYSKERDRANALDGKASFFITVIFAITAIFVPIIPFDKIVSVYTMGSCIQRIIVAILVIGILLAFCVLVAAFIKLYDAYKLTDYMRPSLECINEDRNHRIPNEHLFKGLCDHYKTVVDNHIVVNDKKCESISDGVRLCAIGFLLLIISAISLKVTIGGL